MEDEKSSLSQDLDGGTRVDLGDDLLENTVELPQLPSNIPPPPQRIDIARISPGDPGSIEDLLQSAKIFMSEGMTEDAKKTLRQILLTDTGNALARKLLDTIQQEELKQIFSPAEKPRHYGSKTEAVLEEVDSELLMRRLDSDLELGLFSPEDSTVSIEQLTLFADPKMLEDFCQRLEKDLSSASPRDWIDLGIAFLEMDHFTIAVRLFNGACRRLNLEPLSDNELALSANSLLALSLVLGGRPFEAIATIQPILKDSDIKREDKVEFLYLMGRTHESIQKVDLALQYYMQVVEIDPNYRDIDRRLRKKRE